MRCHTGPEKQRGNCNAASLREPTQTHQGRKTLGSNVLYQCNRGAERTHGGGTSQQQKRLGFEYARTTEKRMIAPEKRMIARSSQPEQSQNILQFRQFRRDLQFAPKCAQCRLRMAIMRAEPDLKAREFRITYRCLDCGLLDRRTIEGDSGGREGSAAGQGRKARDG